MFPLMYFDQSISWATALPGLIGMGIPLIGLFAIPVWPIHRRLSDAKLEQVTALNERITAHNHGAPNITEHPEALAQLNQLLQYRREIMQAPVWPFDAGAITRLLLYIIIVPLTWAGAALIEMAMETFL